MHGKNQNYKKVIWWLLHPHPIPILTDIAELPHLGAVTAIGIPPGGSSKKKKGEKTC
jgi:hypothetical protein